MENCPFLTKTVEYPPWKNPSFSNYLTGCFYSLEKRFFILEYHETCYAVRSVHGSANPFFTFSVPCWVNRKIWNWHLFRLIRLQCYKCLNCFCFKAPFYWNFIIWRRQRIFVLKNNGKVSKNCQNSRSPCFFSWIHKSYPSKTKITQYLLFTVLCYLFPKKDKQK